MYEYPKVFDTVDETGRQYNKIEIKHQDQLFDMIENHIEDNKGKKFPQVLADLGIKDTVNVVDNRTLALLQLYKFFSHSSTGTPDFWDTQIWYDVVTISEEYKPRGMYG